MKLNKSFEQAVYVITMLALQEGKQPVKSHVLSEILQVSDSYLKKVLMKLSKAGLVSSSASKNGGYQLAIPVENISLKDVFFALELQADVLEFKQMAHRIYDDEADVQKAEQMVQTTLENGLKAMYGELEKLCIADLLHHEAYEHGAIDWNQRIKTDND